MVLTKKGAHAFETLVCDCDESLHLRSMLPPAQTAKEEKKFFPDSLPRHRPFPAAAAAADFRDGPDGHSALICRGCGEGEAAGSCCGDRQAPAMPGALMMTDAMVSKLHGETAWLASSRPKMSPWSSQSTGGV